MESYEGIPHVATRRVLPTSFGDDSLPYRIEKEMLEKREMSSKRASRLTLEVAVFFDEAGYKIFAPYLHYDNNKVVDMLLAYMNGVIFLCLYYSHFLISLNKLRLAKQKY